MQLNKDKRYSQISGIIFLEILVNPADAPRG